MACDSYTPPSTSTSARKTWWVNGPRANSSASAGVARPASTAIPACNAARAIPAQPSSDRFTDTKSGCRCQALTAAARAKGSGSIASEVEPNGQTGNRGADRRDGGVAHRGGYRLHAVGVTRMDVHGERTRTSNSDRVGGKLGRRQRYRMMLRARTRAVQARLHRHLSRHHPKPGSTQQQRRIARPATTSSQKCRVSQRRERRALGVVSRPSGAPTSTGPCRPGGDRSTTLVGG